MVQREARLDRVVVVNNESFGGDAGEMGGKLMGIFLTKLRMTEKLPDAIVFFNSGVKLLTKDSAVRPSLEGLIEDDEEFGEERLGELLRENSGLSPTELIEKITGTVKEFAGSLPQMDDMTLVIVKRDG